MQGSGAHFFLLISACPEGKNTKFVISGKLRIAQKNIIYAKNERQINFNLPCKFGHFWRRLNFWAPRTPLLDAHNFQSRHVIFSTPLVSTHCASFMSRWLLLRDVCLHIFLSWETTRFQLNLRIWMLINDMHIDNCAFLVEL